MYLLYLGIFLAYPQYYFDSLFLLSYIFCGYS